MNPFFAFRYLVCIIGFLMMGIHSSHSQDDESVIDTHQNFKKYIFKDPDSAYYFINRLREQKNSFKQALPEYYYHQDLGQYYFVKHQIDSAEYHYAKAFEVSSKLGRPRLSIDSDIWLATLRHFTRDNEGAFLHWQGIYEKSKELSYVDGIANSYLGFSGLTSDLAEKIEYGYKVDSLYTRNDTIGTHLVNAYNMMGNIYLRSFEDDSLVKIYAEKGLKISENIQYPHGTVRAYRLLAESAMRQKNYEKARSFLNKSLEVGLELNDQVIIDGALLNLGKTYLLSNETDKTIEYLKKCSQDKSNASENSLVGWVHLLWAETYLSKNDLPKVWDHLTKARHYSDIGGDLRPFDIDLYNIEHQYYSGIGDYRAAYEAKKNYDQVYESLEEDRNKNAFVLNEHRKSKQEIALLKSEKELADQQRRNQRNLLLAGIGISLLALVFLFILYRNRQRTSRKLREIDALKTNFFTNISHEFRTPLTLISSPIQETLLEPDLSPEKRSHFEMASRNTSRLLDLVDQLLELSKIDSGNRKLQLEEGNVTHLIAAYCESFSYLARQKSIDFRISLEPTGHNTWFDRDALQKIIVNLLGNAIKYTPQGGKIRVSTLYKDKSLTFVVQNSGKGLSKDQLKSIFDRFYQTDGQAEGSGIGLSLVKELVELHKGAIVVDSELNGGTKFTVTLSMNRLDFKDAVITTSDIGSATAIDIVNDRGSILDKGEPEEEGLPLLLIVEDNADVQTLLANTFKAKYQILKADNGQEGITLALEHVPDIIVSDVMMPFKDGIELTKTLKEDQRTSHIPIVLLTAKAGDDNELSGINVGADDYITKPFNVKILTSKVDSLIALRKRLQSRYSQEVILKPKDIAITSVDEQFLEDVQSVLDEKLVESSFSVEEFSKALHMSRMQLHRKLKALTGLSASEFIRSQRLKLATQFLMQSGLNVSEIGYSVGFNDAAYFTKCFREAYGCTPTDYSRK